MGSLTSIVYSSQNVLRTEKLCPFSATFFRSDRKVNGSDSVLSFILGLCMSAEGLPMGPDRPRGKRQELSPNSSRPNTSEDEPR
jgi:hypothetical protein